MWNRLRGTTPANALPSWCSAITHFADYGTDVPDDWDIDNDGAAVSQLQVNDGATM